MAYDAFNPNQPTSQGTSLADTLNNSRKNQRAIVDMVMAGSVPGWAYSQTGGTAEQPAVCYYKNGDDWYRETLTWGTSGGEAGNVVQRVVDRSRDAGETWETIGAETATYDVNGNCTATDWT